MKRGKTILHSGPMFSGKTTALFEDMKKEIHSNHRVQLIRFENDTRYDANMAASHDGVKMKAILASSLVEDPELLQEDVTVIGIDEGHFFAGLSEFCDRWNKKGVHIYVSGLLTNFKNELWPEITKLLPICTNILFHQAKCINCGDPACRSKAIQIMPSNGILIAADDAYVPTCFDCQDKEISQDKQLKRKNNMEIINNLFRNYYLSPPLSSFFYKLE